MYYAEIAKETIDSVISYKPGKSLLTSLETSQNGKRSLHHAVQTGTSGYSPGKILKKTSYSVPEKADTLRFVRTTML
ncbi:MAG: hypothetical protein BWK80_62605 [Desulfobacteraceae bacterium IS3]|nr:MAG: hypothetical protein BWK80_62605 [Desulfobacteraceae bacterium IS3]